VTASGVGEGAEPGADFGAATSHPRVVVIATAVKTRSPRLRWRMLLEWSASLPIRAPGEWLENEGCFEPSMRVLFCSLLLLSSLPSFAGSPSEASTALERGDLDSALRLLPEKPSSDAEAVRAQVYLARGQLAEAKSAAGRVPPEHPAHHRLAWSVARAEGSSAAIRTASSALCRQGDPTGRACVDAEFHHQMRPPELVEIDRDAELKMSPDAPFPVIVGETSLGKTGLIVDTGASESVITRQYAERLGLKVTEQAFPVGVAGGGASSLARLAMLDSLQLGPIRIQHLPVLVIDSPELDEQALPIILSPQQAFSGYVVTFDFAQRRLRVAHQAAPPVRGARVSTFNYITAGQDLAVSARFGDGPLALFGLDTGHSGACVVSNAYRAGGVALKEITLNGVGGTYRASLTPLMMLKVGGLVLKPSQPCAVSPMLKNGIQLAGLLGNELWRDGVLVLDTARRQVTLAIARR
jgi:hypothetical protein